jgi:hypothetical protein
MGTSHHDVFKAGLMRGKQTIFQHGGVVFFQSGQSFLL